MNKKLVAALTLSALLLSTNSFAANETQKLDAIEKLGLKIDQSIDKSNLKDEIKLQRIQTSRPTRHT